MDLERFVIPVVVAFWLTMICVPLVKLLAMRINMVDKPNARKVHREPIPLMGGLGIFLPFVISLQLFYHGTTNLNLKGVVICAFLIVLLGFWDDKVGGINWRTKLLGQIAIAVIVVIGFELKIKVFPQDWVNILVSIFWLTFITNSLNLLDNMDGLSAGVAAIAGFFYFALAYRSGQPDLALFSLLLSTCAFSFLKYNFSPASIFMGDMGSMFLGFTLGCIAIRLQVIEMSNWQMVKDFAQYFSNFTHYTFFTSFLTSIIPVLVLGLPVFDTILVSVLRTLNGLSISTPGKDHSSHRLMQIKGRLQRYLDKFILLIIRATGRRKKSQFHVLRGMAHTRAVLILYASGACLGLAALLLPLLSLKGVFVCILVVIAIGILSAKKLAEVLVYKK